MCYRIFNKPAKSHDWRRVSEFESLQEALAAMEQLAHRHHKVPGKWVLRNIRGEVISRFSVSEPNRPCTYWTPSQVLCS